MSERDPEASRDRCQTVEPQPPALAEDAETMRRHGSPTGSGE